MFFSKNNDAFTLIEMLMVIVVVSIWIISIMSVINYWQRYVWQIRQDVIASNLAREWAELVFNIRDTNWERWSGRRDQCWLLEDPSIEDPSIDDSWCESMPWIKAWAYVLSWQTPTDWEQIYNYLSWVNEGLDLSDWITDDDRTFALCSNEDASRWTPCPWDDNPSPEWSFFRMIDIKWLYDKKEGSTLDCDRWNDTDWAWNDCSDPTAKELRFCSVVEYVWHWQGKVELCTSMTNFKN